MAFKTYYYDHQIKKYMLQFMAIFAGMQVQVGKNDRDGGEEMASVPIMYGNRDRVVGWIKGQYTQNKPLRLPIMSANIAGIDMAPDLRKGVGAVRRDSFVKSGGVVPDDIKVVRQLMPVPYKVVAEVGLWASNTEQRYQILEQLLTLFDPMVQIQKNDEIFDWTKITTVELLNVGFDDNYPIGADRRFLLTTMNFEFPVYLAAPSNVKDDFVKDIWVRLGAIDMSSVTPEQIIADLDAQGIEYEQWFDGDALDLPEF